MLTFSYAGRYTYFALIAGVVILCTAPPTFRVCHV
jgi:hypothetical protein